MTIATETIWPPDHLALLNCYANEVADCEATIHQYDPRLIGGEGIVGISVRGRRIHIMWIEWQHFNGPEVKQLLQRRFTRMGVHK